MVAPIIHPMTYVPDRPAPTAKRLAVLITCFNRKEITLRCLAALMAQEIPSCTMEIFVVDDASQDGTYEAIAARYPEVRLYRGTGGLFWNGGMRQAFAHALPENFDWYLWLNDDTFLYSAALSSMIETAREFERSGVAAIIAGSTQDPVTLAQTYGGIVKVAGFNRSAYRLAQPDPERVRLCDTMNGNCTLIPRAIARVAGNLDSRFRHNFGDMDYGLRAKSLGFAVYAVPGFVGSCTHNPRSNTFRDTAASLRVRWADLTSPKGCPWAEWSYFSRRHFGRLWLLYALSPYAKVLLQSLLNARFS